jgi:hypothetical protein
MKLMRFGDGMTINRGIGLAIVTALLKEMDACVLATTRQINDSLTRLETEFHERMRITLGDMYANLSLYDTTLSTEYCIELILKQARRL